MANRRFDVAVLQPELEQILDKHPDEIDAIPAIAALASKWDLKFNVVRRAYRTVQRIRSRRKPIE